MPSRPGPVSGAALGTAPGTVSGVSSDILHAPDDEPSLAPEVRWFNFPDDILRSHCDKGVVEFGVASIEERRINLMVDEHEDVFLLTRPEVKDDIGSNPELVRHGRDFSIVRRAKRKWAPARVWRMPALKVVGSRRRLLKANTVGGVCLLLRSGHVAGVLEGRSAGLTECLPPCWRCRFQDRFDEHSSVSCPRPHQGAV